MSSTRQKKVASLIQRTLSDIFMKDKPGPPGSLITVTAVEMSPDLLNAAVFLSVFNAPEPDAVIKEFDTHSGEWRGKLGKELRHHLRRVPELSFRRDDTLDQVYRLEDVFRSIRKEDSED